MFIRIIFKNYYKDSDIYSNRLFFFRFKLIFKVEFNENHLRIMSFQI